MIQLMNQICDEVGGDVGPGALCSALSLFLAGQTQDRDSALLFWSQVDMRKWN